MSRYKHLVNAACFVILLTCAAIHTAAQEVADDSPAWREYTFLLRSSTLEWLSEEPFHVKVDLTINDLDGKRIDTGTAEETWGTTKLMQINTHFVQEGTGSGATYDISHPRERYLIREILGNLARPFPSVAKRATFNTREFTQTIDDADLNCLSLVDPGSGKPAQEAYCANSANQLSIMTGPGSLIVRRQNFRKFHAHEIPMDIAFLYNGNVAITAHVTELDSVLDVQHPSSHTGNSGATLNRIPAAIMQGQQIRKPTPEYPKKAKKKHIAGTVLLAAVISKQGALTNVEVISSPDPLLGDSALKAVQQWTYKPYLLNGQPAEVDTTITVNFNLNQP